MPILTMTNCFSINFLFFTFIPFFNNLYVPNAIIIKKKQKIEMPVCIDCLHYNSTILEISSHKLNIRRSRDTRRAASNFYFSTVQYHLMKLFIVEPSAITGGVSANPNSAWQIYPTPWHLWFSYNFAIEPDAMTFTDMIRLRYLIWYEMLFLKYSSVVSVG